MTGLIIFVLICWGVIRFLKRRRRGNSSQPEYPFSGTPKEEYLPYRKKPYFLTRAENNVLKQLESILGDKYYIFPQVHYSKIIYADGQQNYHNPWFNKIDRKSADFVLFDKVNISPVLVIEHDDATHYRHDRIERDEFIEKALLRSGIPLLRVQPYTGDEKLRLQIGAKIKIELKDAST